MALSKSPLPFEVMIWTSSHGTPFHHFPVNLVKAYDECTHHNKHLITMPSVNAIPGRCMKPGFFLEVQADFEKIDPKARRMNIILMGDNDVRCMALPGSYRVLKQGGRLVELHGDTHHALVLCGLLPSPATHNITSRLFDITSCKLKELCEESHTTPAGRFISYLKLSHIFNDQDGLIDFKKYFETDGVHLNPSGAFQLAQYLVNNAIDFAESCQKMVDIAYADLENFIKELSVIPDESFQNKDMRSKIE